MRRFVLSGALSIATVVAGTIAVAVIVDEPTSLPITRTELDGASGQTVFGAIATLRPAWISPDRLTENPPLAYLEMRCAEMDCLRWIGTDQVEEIRLVSADTAASSWLRPVNSDAIIVALRPRAISDTTRGGKE